MEAVPTREPARFGPGSRRLIRRSAPADQPRADALAPHWRILVVDDDIDAAWSLATILELEGHDVRTAFDGGSALDVAESFQPQLAILDIAMPVMHGYEVCRRLRSTPAGQQMVIAALTGFAQKNYRRRSQKAGFDIHLVKPVDPCDLDRLLTVLMPQAH